MTPSALARHRAHTMQRWVERRRDKGSEPNADAIAARIRHNWPTTTEAEMEAIEANIADIDAAERSRRAIPRRAHNVRAY